jgi:predicted peptidase
MSVHRLALVVTALALSGAAAAQVHQPDGEVPDGLTVQTAQTFRGADGLVMRYLLALPEGYAEGAERWPLVLFLHGAGERGADLRQVAVHGPPREVEAGRAFPFVLVSPQQPPGRRWSADTLAALLDDVVARYRVDPDRIYLTGLSMGGQGVYRLATAQPERFAAIAPVCGWSLPDRACALASLPTWIFHGMRDDVIRPWNSTAMFDAMRACGATEVGLTLYPDANHNSWERTYANPDVYDWLLSHTRAAD